MRLERSPRTRPNPADLTQAVERQIVQRTWGRIHRLAVELADDRVIVHGLTSTYYTKQLALQAALDAIGSSGATEVDLDIEVNSSPLRSTIALASHAGRAWD
jgi:hypothetical protein